MPTSTSSPCVRRALSLLAFIVTAGGLCANDRARAIAAESGGQGVVLLARRGWQAQEAELMESLRIYTRDLDLLLETEILPHEATSTDEQARAAEARCEPDVALVLWFNGTASDAKLSVFRCGAHDSRAWPYATQKDGGLASHMLALKLRALLVSASSAGPAKASKAQPVATTPPATPGAPPSPPATPVPPVTIPATPPATTPARGRTSPAPPSGERARPPVTRAADETSPVATLEEERTASATSTRAVPAFQPLAPGSPSLGALWAGTGAREGRLLGQGVEAWLALPAGGSGRGRARLSGAWTRFASQEVVLPGSGDGSDMGAGAAAGTPPASLALSSLALRIAWERALVRAPRWELWGGAAAGLHALLAEGTTPDRHGTSRMLSGSVGPCVSVRGALAGPFTWEVQAHLETQVPRRRFALDGQTAADLGLLQLGVGAGLGASF